MSYIGRPLQGANLAVMSSVGDGSDTTPIATLDYATTTNGIAVYLDGVRQLAGTDFNVTAQTTLTFTTAPANGVGVDVYFLGLELSIPTPADATVTTAKIAANAVDETKLKDALVADFTEVVVAVGDSILLGDATDSGNTKRDTVQGILDLVPAGGSWVLIGTQTASADASLTQTGLSATYKMYAVVATDLVPSTDGSYASLRVGDSSGVDSGSSDYRYHNHLRSANAAGYQANTSTGDDVSRFSGNVGNATGEGFSAVIYVANTTTQRIGFSGTGNGTNAAASDQATSIGGERKAVITMDRIQILFDAGNITSGIFSVYGLANS